MKRAIFTLAMRIYENVSKNGDDISTTSGIAQIRNAFYFCSMEFSDDAYICRFQRPYRHTALQKYQHFAIAHADGY